MHGIQFNDSVPNDSNRTADGEELRDEFISLDDNIGLDEFTEMAGLGKASIFEVLVGLARRATTVTEALKRLIMVQDLHGNLGLLKYSDRRFVPRNTAQDQHDSRTFNARSFKPDGEGGIFPLKIPLSRISEKSSCGSRWRLTSTRMGCSERRNLWTSSRSRSGEPMGELRYSQVSP